MDSAASQFRRDRRNAQNAESAQNQQARDAAADASSAAVSGETIGWDPEREVVVSASAIPTAAAATWAPASDAQQPAAPSAAVIPASVPPSGAPDVPFTPAAAPGQAAAPAPAPAAAPLPPADPSRGGESVRLGWDVGQPALYSGEAPAVAPVKRGLVSGATVLPEITEAPPAPRKLWKHPAFIVSSITTVLALGVAVTLLVLAAVSGGPPRVTGLDITEGSGGVALAWSGPNTAYDLYVVGSDGTITDISQIVRGRDAWIPRTFAYFDDDSCFVVRAESVTGDVSLSADALEEQGAASTCVADADDGA
ncbi:hypothetical protein [Labedella endophytica]|uniref:Uncharacterized protein n=1 Tax=Labedella endophytica TaxID=1523160 RepID=A0A433JU21_9MICO|nr:hypothetical protein [Labedella endophytica]RUR01584.1 hypothetical protein ELQ94_08845 [Labedella endophytica]